MATIAELQTRLTVDNVQFKRGLEESQAKIAGFSRSSVTSFLKIGAAVASLGYVIKSAFNALHESEERVSKLVDASTRLGIGIPALQRLQFVAEQSGISVESMNNALGKMQKTLGNASAGSEQAAKAFTQIGLSVSDLMKLSPDEQYIAISDAIKGIASPAQQAAAAVAIFSKGGIDQLSALKDNVRGMVDEFKGLGMELTGTQARAVEKYGDEVNKVALIWTKFKDQVAAALAGPLTEMIQGFEESIRSMGGMSVAAQKFADVIMPTLRAVATLAQLAILPFEGLDATIKAAALSAAKLAEIRAKSKLSDATALQEVDPEGLKKANNEYVHAVAYLKAMKEEIKGVKTVSEDLVSTLPSIADVLMSGDGTNKAMDLLGVQKQITDQLNLQESAVEKAIRAEQKKYDNQKDITAEMRKQVDAAHSLYEEVRAAQSFEKELRKDLDNVEASIRQDQQENDAGIAHAGDRDPTLDQYAPNKDSQGRLLSDSSDSQRTLGLKEDYNNKIN